MNVERIIEYLRDIDNTFLLVVTFILIVLVSFENETRKELKPIKKYAKRYNIHIDILHRYHCKMDKVHELRQRENKTLCDIARTKQQINILVGEARELAAMFNALDKGNYIEPPKYEEE